jgi:hypothetical protein
MGIDRHELEHRNWRPLASKINHEFDRELAEQLDTSIVPDDNESTPPALNPKQSKRVKIDQF